MLPSLPGENEPFAQLCRIEVLNFYGTSAHGWQGLKNKICEDGTRNRETV